MQTSKNSRSIWVKRITFSALTLGLIALMEASFASGPFTKKNDGVPSDLPGDPKTPTQTQHQQQQQFQQLQEQRDKLLKQIVQIQQDQTLTQEQREMQLSVKQNEFTKVQQKVAYRQKGENYRLNRAAKKDEKIQGYLSEIDQNNAEIAEIMAQIDEHWANTAPSVDERPGMPAFAKRMKLPTNSTVKGGKGKGQAQEQEETSPSQQTQSGKNGGTGTMDKHQLAAAYSKIMQRNGKIKSLEAKINRQAKKYKRLTGEEHEVVDGKSGKFDPNRRPSKELETASKENPVTVVSNGKGKDGKKPIDPNLAKNPNCWVSTPDPIAELIPNVVFETGKSTLTEEQADDFMAQLKILETKLKENGHEKLGRIEAISSASFIPRRAAGGNEALAAARGSTINSNFRSGFFHDASLNELIAPNFSMGLDETVEKEQGPAWNPADAKKKSIKPSEEEIRAKAEELMQDPNAPFSKTNLDTAVSELKKCCSKSQFDLKYRPHQYAKIKIYGSVFAPENPECVRTSQNNAAVSDHTAPSSTSTNEITVAPASGSPSNSGPANSAGTLVDE